MCDHCGCRSFAAIADLTAEHVQILSKAWTLAESTLSRHAVSAEAVADLLAILDVHVSKEETGLYPKLVELEGLSGSDCANLEREHEALRHALAGGRFDRSDYYALAAHIEVEELELFSAAMLRFEEPEWDALDAVHDLADELEAQR